MQLYTDTCIVMCLTRAMVAADSYHDAPQDAGKVLLRHTTDKTHGHAFLDGGRKKTGNPVILSHHAFEKRFALIAEAAATPAAAISGRMGQRLFELESVGLHTLAQHVRVSAQTNARTRDLPRHPRR